MRPYFTNWIFKKAGGWLKSLIFLSSRREENSSGPPGDPLHKASGCCTGTHMRHTTECFLLPRTPRLRVKCVRQRTPLPYVSVRLATWQPFNQVPAPGMVLEIRTGKGCYHGNWEGVRPTNKPKNCSLSSEPRFHSPAEWKKTSLLLYFFVFLLLIGPQPPQTPTAATTTPGYPRRASRSALRHAEECKPLTIKDNSGGLWVIMCHRCVIRLAGFCNQPPHFPKQKVNSRASTLSLARHSGGREQ